jgi:hypothetical protein
VRHELIRRDPVTLTDAELLDTAIELGVDIADLQMFRLALAEYNAAISVLDEADNRLDASRRALITATFDRLSPAQRRPASTSPIRVWSVDAR